MLFLQPEFENPIAGYLSIHKCPESLLLKWTPNLMMSGETGTEKSHYWNRVLTVDLSDIVFLHCHQSGKSYLRIFVLTFLTLFDLPLDVFFMLCYLDYVVSF